jgi:TM2 domain-containing membrane protein YozV
MEQNKVDIYIATNAKFFESHLIPQIHDMLCKADDSKFIMIQTVNLKDPTIMLIVSLFGGHFGIDRFLIGDTGLGVGKLLTCGGFGIWTIVDWFMIMGRTRELNFQHLQRVLY